MTARTFASFAVLVAAAGAVSCSSKDDPPFAGGARLALQGVDTTNMVVASKMLATCASPGDILIATKGDDGQDKLVVDGDNGASVNCQIDGSNFSFSVSYQGRSLNVGGSYTGNTSTNAAVTLVTAGITYSSREVTPCTLTFDTNTSGQVVVDGKVSGHLKCPGLKQKDIDAGCGINVSGSAGSTGNDFIKFSNCKGF